jgi:hypothetical protein
MKKRRLADRGDNADWEYQEPVIQFVIRGILTIRKPGREWSDGVMV